MSIQFPFDLASYAKHLARNHRQVVPNPERHTQVLNRIAHIFGFHDGGKMITFLGEITYQNADTYRSKLPSQTNLSHMLEELSLKPNDWNMWGIGENGRFYAEYLFLLKGHSTLYSLDNSTLDSTFCFPNSGTIRFQEDFAKPFLLRNRKPVMVRYTPIKGFSPVAGVVSEQNPSREYMDQATLFVRTLKTLFPDTHFSLPSSDVAFRCLEELAKKDLGVIDFPFGGAHLLIGPEAHR